MRKGREQIGVWMIAIALAAVASLAASSLAAAAASGRCTIKGTSGPDVLSGTPGPDVICGGAGGDLLRGLGQGDRLQGGAGDDRLYGGSGPDLLLGGAGDDRMVGGSGADAFSGGPGSNACGRVEAQDQLRRCRSTRDHPVAHPTARPCWFSGGCGGYLEPPDVEAPKLGWLSLSPGSIDTAAGQTNLSLYVDAWDASPIATVVVEVRGPQGPWRQVSLDPGDARNPAFHAVTTLPADSPSGTYQIDRVTMVDSHGNTSVVAEAEMAAGLPRYAEVYSGPDEAGPTLTDFAISPLSVDTSGDPATVTMTAHATDALSGVDQLGPSFDIPSQVPSEVLFPRGFGYGMARVDGSVHDSTWTAEIHLPRYAAQGEYRLNGFQLHDQAGNFTTYDRAEMESMGFPVTFVQQGSGDTEPPGIDGFSLGPPVLHAARGEGTVAFFVHTSDDLAGVDAEGFSGVYVNYDPPGNPPVFEATGQGPVLAAGTELDGVWRLETTLGPDAPTGTYEILGLGASDRAGNVSEMDRAELEGKGWDLSFENLP
jgi:hypothetical protein